MYRIQGGIFMEMEVESIKDYKQEDLNNAIIRNITKSIYDVQKLRIAIGNRVVSNFNHKLGTTGTEGIDDTDIKDIDNSSNSSSNSDNDYKDSDKKDKENKKIIEQLRKEYHRITDGYIENKTTLRKYIKENTGIITDVFEYELIDNYLKLVDSENGYIKALDRVVTKHPLWIDFLSKVRGCGPLMSGVIISELDPYKAKYPSSFWKYAGLDVVRVEDKDGNMIEEGRGRKAGHLVNKVYKDSDGNETKTRGITYNAFLKSKLVGVLATSFLRSKSPYSEIYYNYKSRLNNTPNLDISDKHKHNRALRYMIKQFLVDLWVAWRELEGLDTPEPYYVAKLGMERHKNTILDRIRSGEIA